MDLPVRGPVIKTGVYCNYIMTGNLYNGRVCFVVCVFFFLLLFEATWRGARVRLAYMFNVLFVFFIFLSLSFKLCVLVEGRKYWYWLCFYAHHVCLTYIFTFFVCFFISFCVLLISLSFASFNMFQCEEKVILSSLYSTPLSYDIYLLLFLYFPSLFFSRFHFIFMSFSVKK